MRRYSAVDTDALTVMRDAAGDARTCPWSDVPRVDYAQLRLL